jgi:hypothetical protein
VVSFSDLFLVFVIILDFVFSLWNAYAAGLTRTLLRNQPGQRFAKISAVAALGLAFAGMTYATLIVLSWVALLLNLLTVGDFLFLVSFDFLVFGAMIIGFGLVVTAQSVAIAYRERNFGAIGVAVWNVFSEIWDISIYAEGFQDAAGVVSQDRDKVNLYAVVAAALGVAFIVTYVAYRHGVRKAEDSIAASRAQTLGEATGSGGGPVDHAHPLRTVVIVALVTLIVVVAIIAIAPYVTPSTTVNVTSIDVWAPDNVCGLGTNLVSYSGFTDSVGSTDAFTLELPNFNSTACTVTGATTNTSGFGLTDVMVPVNVPGGQNASLDLTVILPGSAYSGTLNLVYI